MARVLVSGPPNEIFKLYRTNSICIKRKMIRLNIVLINHLGKMRGSQNSQSFQVFLLLRYFFLITNILQLNVSMVHIPDFQPLTVKNKTAILLYCNRKSSNKISFTLKKLNTHCCCNNQEFHMELMFLQDEIGLAFFSTNISQLKQII